MRFDNPEDIIQLTPLWKGERFPNGRPRVPDDVLRRMAAITNEEAWSVLSHNDYKYQFEADWKIIHPGKIMVGRAVTAVMVPERGTWTPPSGIWAEGRRTQRLFQFLGDRDPAGG